MNDDLNADLIEEPYPFQELLGFRMIGWSEGFARFEMPLAPRLMNRYGIPHGGVYASLLDTVMGFAGSWTGEPENRKLCMTLSLTTNFLAQPTGERLVAEGRRVGGGRSVYYAEGELCDDTRTVVATAVGTFRYRKRSGAA